MPRTGRGGRRELPVGQASGNRTDLNQHLPVEVASGQPYGQRTQQENAQRAVPMGSTPAVTQPMVPLQRTLNQAAPKAGSLPFLDPTNRPNEPVTAGLPFGAGPGPEVMNQVNVLPLHPVAHAFDELAQSPNASPSVSNLAETARLLGL